jgi:hypothetical protein
MGDGEKRRRRAGNCGQPGGEIVEPRGGTQALAREHHVRGDPE